MSPFGRDSPLKTRDLMVIYRSQVKTPNHEIMIGTCFLSLEDQRLLGYTEIQAKFYFLNLK